MTEREKLLSGLEYNSRDEELIAMCCKMWTKLVIEDFSHRGLVIIF